MKVIWRCPSFVIQLWEIVILFTHFETAGLLLIKGMLHDSRYFAGNACETCCRNIQSVDGYPYALSIFSEVIVSDPATALSLKSVIFSFSSVNASV
jgi:hypothetical protein